MVTNFSEKEMHIASILRDKHTKKIKTLCLCLL
jgi:hypothetical protein